jgi:hypothetical protein
MLKISNEIIFLICHVIYIISYPLLLMLLFPIEKCSVFLLSIYFVLSLRIFSKFMFCYLEKKIKNPFPHKYLFGVLIKMWIVPLHLHARFPSFICIFVCQHRGLCICTVTRPATSSGIINITNDIYFEKYIPMKIVFWRNYFWFILYYCYNVLYWEMLQRWGIWT